MSIHPTALVAPSVQMGTDVSVGPFCIIEEGVTIGDRTRIDANAQLRKGAQVGADCLVGSGALISADPHFRGFDSEGVSSGAIIGDGNQIREYVTVTARKSLFQPHRFITAHRPGLEGVQLLGNRFFNPTVSSPRIAPGWRGCNCCFDTKAAARRSIFDYLETFYNQSRRHSTL